jgi:hypothetical protein
VRPEQILQYCSRLVSSQLNPDLIRVPKIATRNQHRP